MSGIREQMIRVLSDLGDRRMDEGVGQVIETCYRLHCGQDLGRCCCDSAQVLEWLDKWGHTTDEDTRDALRWLAGWVQDVMED